MRNCKEWLNTKTFEYKQSACMFGHSEWIEIPGGADFYVRSKMYKDNFFFCMDNSGIIETFDTILKNSWHRESTFKTINLSDNYDILWQRPTKPEVLPFIDDNPHSLNDQYAEIEELRQVEIHGTSKAKPDFNFLAAQASGGSKMRENNHYFIDVSDVDEVDFYEIAKRYNVTDPAIQHILKKCLAIGNRGHKDLETDLKDILKTAKRALQINGFGE